MELTRASYQTVVLGEFVVVRSIRAIEPALGGSAFALVLPAGQLSWKWEGRPTFP